MPAPILLLTGGTGFVGRRLAPRLTAAFPAYDRLALVQGDQAAPDGFSAATVDLTDAGALEAIIAAHPPTIVVHMAAQSSVGAGLVAARSTWAVNVGATIGLATAVARHAPDATVLFTSSGEVYGAAFRSGPASETTPVAPLNSYAVSKLAGERILADLLPPGARLIVTRALNHSGPGQDERFVLPSWARQIARAEAGLSPPRLLVGNLDAARDFLHVDDVIDAYLALLGAAPTLPPRSTFNVASGRATPLRELLQRMRVRSRTDLAIEIDSARLRPSDVPVATADIAAITTATGWRPRRSLDGLLDELMADARAVPRP